MIGLFTWMLMGLIAGAVAKLFTPGDQKGGCIMTTLLGIAGAVVGGKIGQMLNILPDEDPSDKIPGAGGIITAILGAMLLLFIFKKFATKKDGDS